MSRTPAVRVELVDAALAAGLAAVWCLWLLPRFSPNVGLAGALVVLAYFLAYALVGWLAIASLRRVLALLVGDPEPGSTSPPRPRLRRARRIALAAWVMLPLAALIASSRDLVLAGGDRSRDATAMPTTNAKPPRSVTLIAMDGLDPGLLRRLVGAGKLPSFRFLLENGVSGPLATVSPHSPVVWTSIATGRPVEAHGVDSYTTAYLRNTSVALPDHGHDFLGRGLDRLFGFRELGAVSSNQRRVKAVWELLDDYGLASLVINWWATYPAERVRGVMISNHAIPWSSFEADDVRRAAVHPHVVHPASLQREVGSVVRGALAGSEVQNLARDPFSVAGSRFFALRDAIAFALLDRFSDPSFALSTAYVQGIDTGSHAFSTLVFGPNLNRRRPPKVSPAHRTRLWEELVVTAYERMDAELGERLRRLRDRELLVVVSDHGWRYDGTSHWDNPPGTFLFYGPDFRAGASLEAAHVYDILPTLAHLLGLPVSRELPGRVLRDAIRPDRPASTRYVERYGPRGRAVAAEATALDEGHIERLRSLGYVE